MRFRAPNKFFTKLYKCFLYRFAGQMVLLLTTTGRKSGKAHSVGLQYELINGQYWVGAANGTRTDWLCNLRALPMVWIQTGARKFQATAEVIDDPQRISDFLAYRLGKRPHLLWMILKMGGVKGKITREKLLAYATHIKVVVFSPLP